MDRGFRNNNPGNIRPGQHFKGEVGVDAGNYAIFDTAHNGIRAIAKDLETKLAEGLNTVVKIVFKYAPPSENDTQSYVKAVCSDLGIKADARIYPTDMPLLDKLVIAIIKHENGSCPYEFYQIADAVDDAFGVNV